VPGGFQYNIGRLNNSGTMVLGRVDITTGIMEMIDEFGRVYNVLCYEVLVCTTSIPFTTTTMKTTTTIPTTTTRMTTSPPYGECGKVSS
jgi:hypothetical protein